MNSFKRVPREFHYKDAHFHIVTDAWDEVCNRIIADRQNLESFIKEYSEFQTSLVPLNLPVSDDLLPEAVRRMQHASRLSGLGPMAGVAGTMAQLAVETSKKLGSSESIVENGGDIYLDCQEEVILGLFTGQNSRFNNLALKIRTSMMPLAICTSSSRMGHSLSFGDCDIVTVFSKDASLADAAATLACNSVKRDDDIEAVLNKLISLEGITGVLIVRDEHFGVVGDIPEIIKSTDKQLQQKISKDSSFFMLDE